MCVTYRHDKTLAVKVALNPSTTDLLSQNIHCIGHNYKRFIKIPSNDDFLTYKDVKDTTVEYKAHVSYNWKNKKFTRKCD